MTKGPQIRQLWRQIKPHSITVSFITVACLIIVGAISASATSSPVEGSQGTDVALPLTNSAVTIDASTVLGADSPFAGLSITVNQTTDLSNQAISVTWTGGTPTNSDIGSTGGFNDWYLQMFQCWGPDDGENSSDPGPAPTGCEFGANEVNQSVYGLSNSGGPVGRQVESGDPASYAYVDPGGSGTYIPFQPADGTPAIDLPTTVSTQASDIGQAVWDNPYFDYTTTNEIDYARTYSDGTGSQEFTVDTGLQAPGLGCGQQIQQPNQTTITPKCWLVIVPRANAVAENTAGETSNYIQTSPLSAEAWSHRISIPLSFNPIGSSCPIGANEERIVGSELAQPAIDNWEPSLCSSPSSPPYQYSALSDDQARQELEEGGAGAPGMAVMSQPIAPADANSNGSTLYAPLTLSGVVIGLNIDRQSDLPTPDPAEDALVGQSVQNVYLTPRLVAKLLTESYQDQFVGLNPNAAPPGYAWITTNPNSLLDDPDFLQFNPEFAKLTCPDGVDCGGLVVEQPTGDAAYEVWQWIMADPEARAWLNGTPDQWGMTVNPYYSANASINPTGIAFNPLDLDSYPKNDPYEYQNQTQLPAANNELPRPLGMQDFLPYATSLQSAAQETRAANDGDKLIPDYGALSPDTAWTATGPQPPGEAFMLSITDSADAAQFGLQDALISPAGDDSADRPFISPTVSSIEAGEQAMQPSSTVASVLQTDPASTFPDAYPLAMLTYGAVVPASLDKQECADYAGLIDYAAGTGQTQGLAPGDLPLGYAPLDPTLQSQATTTAKELVSTCGQSSSSQPGSNSTSTPNSSTGADQGETTPAESGSVAGAVTSGNASTVTDGSTEHSSPTGTRIATTGPGATARTAAVALPAGRLVIPVLAGVGLLAVAAARLANGFRRRGRARIG